MPLPQLSRGCVQLRAVRIAAPGRFERVLEFALPADAGKAQVVCDCHMHPVAESRDVGAESGMNPMKVIRN
jgi:hypothetical protein